MTTPRTTDRLIRAAIIVLTLATALTHVSLLFPDPVFIINGLGYLALLGAMYLPIPLLVPYRRQIRWLLIGYTLLTISLWLAFGSRILLGYLNKLNEIVLLALLLLEQRHSSSGSRSTNA
jgi:hypothetical protein